MYVYIGVCYWNLLKNLLCQFFFREKRKCSCLALNQNNILEPLFYKDIEYKYEQELRIIVWKRPENNILNTNLSNFNVCQGGSLNIDLDILIEEIYISPNSSDDFMEKIKQLLPDNLKNKVIKKSEISYR